jgi:hypothetical protein
MKLYKIYMVTLMLATFAGCANHQLSPGFAARTGNVQIFTVMGSGGKTTVRALTTGVQCPMIMWDGKTATAMGVRMPADTIPARSGSGQVDNKSAVFDVLVCEAAWQEGAVSASVDGRPVPAPAPAIKRIVIVGDTGCRMKGSENAFQNCNDENAWPWATVASSAAATKPDLVIHMGDIHYRESPCPQGIEGCAGSPWGYGYDAWRADLFEPAKPLLAAAPWVFVRGNHESCSRAGQGWFRFVDFNPLGERTCNAQRFDQYADYSVPYSVPLSKDTQIIIFDSSKTSGKPISPESVTYKKYANDMAMIANLVKGTRQNFFASHHPLLALGSDKKTEQVVPAGNAGLLSVLGAIYPDRLFPVGVTVAMHGHNHVFQAMDFKSDYPISLVMGNSASNNDFPPPSHVPRGSQPYPRAEIDHYASYPGYGFATLDLVPSLKGQESISRWVLTEYSVRGRAVMRCEMQRDFKFCQPLASSN